MPIAVLQLPWDHAVSAQLTALLLSSTLPLWLVPARLVLLLHCGEDNVRVALEEAGAQWSFGLTREFCLCIGMWVRPCLKFPRNIE